MDSFPLTPFFASLAADGIRVRVSDYDRLSLVLRTGGPWSLSQLRGVLLALLVHDPTKQKPFIDRFDSFFDIDAEDVSIPIDNARVLAELAKFAESHPDALAGDNTQRPDDDVTPPMPPSAQPEGKKPAAVFIKYSLTVVALVSFFLGLYSFRVILQSSDIPPISIEEVEQSPEILKPRPRLFFENIGRPQAVPLERNWKDIFAAFGLLLLPVLLYVLHRNLKRKLNPESAPFWDPTAPRHFRRQDIGGKPAPRLSARLLDELADSLAYFRGTTLSRDLDVPASIRATTENGKLPELIFQKRRKIRTLYVLEDAFAESRAWDTTARELAEGLRTRGVSVLQGTFHGSPAQFQGEDRRTHWLMDLDDQRNDYLLLIFSDGKGLRARDKFVIESLAQWPAVAWMELREPRFWDRITERLLRLKMPVYPATPEGLLQAMRRFVSEQGQADELRRDVLQARRATMQSGDLATFVEYHLGDSYKWAQVCAMIQPITFGLADALRRKFMPSLPPERLGRLMSIPGTSHDEAGIKFSPQALPILRNGFFSRWTDLEQEQALEFIMKKIQDAEPKETRSLAHLTWEWILERIRLELEPDVATHHLAELYKTPLRDAIRADLENVALPGGAQPKTDPLAPPPIPLRLKPNAKESLQLLSEMAENVHAPTAPESLLARLKDLWRQTRVYVKLFYDQISSWLTQRARRNQRADLPAELQLEPAGISFQNLRSNARYRKSVRLSNRGGGAITGQLSPGATWLKAEPVRFALTHDSQRVQIRVDTTALSPGPHWASVTVSTEAGDHLIPVQLQIRQSWRDNLAYWWGRLAALMQARVTVALLSNGIAAVLVIAVIPSSLIANWVNRLHNKPPRLEELHAETKPDAPERLVLSAKATDPDGATEQLQYEWNVDGATISSNGKEVALDPGLDARNSSIPLTVTVGIRDSQGGYARFKNDISIAPVPMASPSPATNPSPTPSPRTSPSPSVTPRPSPPQSATPTPTPIRTGGIISFKADRYQITSGESVRLCWELTDPKGQIFMDTDYGGSSPLGRPTTLGPFIGSNCTNVSPLANAVYTINLQSSLNALYPVKNLIIEVNRPGCLQPKPFNYNLAPFRARLLLEVQCKDQKPNYKIVFDIYRRGRALEGANKQGFGSVIIPISIQSGASQEMQVGHLAIEGTDFDRAAFVRLYQQGLSNRQIMDVIEQLDAALISAESQVRKDPKITAEERQEVINKILIPQAQRIMMQPFRSIVGSPTTN